MRKKLAIGLLFSLILAICLNTKSILPSVDTADTGFIADLASNVNHDNQADLPILSPSSPRWDLFQIEAPKSWPVVYGGEGIVVAVVDTGIDASIPALSGKVIEKIRFTSGTDIVEFHDHGTSIAGIIAGKEDSNGVTGVAYNALLLDVIVVENDGSTDAVKVAEGIVWAVDHGAKVINVSIVIDQPYVLLESAVDYAWEKGSIIVAASGNNSSTRPVYPASYPNVIAVAATDKTDSLTDWSNRGDWISVGAPGVDIYSSLSCGKFGFTSGSSYSAALVSGEAALIYPQIEDINKNGRMNDEVRDIILNSCDHSAALSQSVNRINVYKAVTSINPN